MDFPIDLGKSSDSDNQHLSPIQTLSQKKSKRLPYKATSFSHNIILLNKVLWQGKPYKSTLISQHLYNSPTHQEVKCSRNITLNPVVFTINHFPAESGTKMTHDNPEDSRNDLLKQVSQVKMVRRIVSWSRNSHCCDRVTMSGMMRQVQVKFSFSLFSHPAGRISTMCFSVYLW